MVKVWSAAVDAAEGSPVLLEAAWGRGFTGVHLLGNVAENCRDGLERVKVVLDQLGASVPQRRVLVSFTPSDVRKDASHFDLPLAVVLAALITEETFAVNIDEWVFAAEIGLDGSLRAVPGVVPLALAAMAREHCGLVVAEGNLPELAALSRISGSGNEGFKVRAFADLAGVVAWLRTGLGGEDSEGTGNSGQQAARSVSFADMNLSPELRLLAQVSAAGAHPLLLRGVPGTGKSMFAHRLVSLLPPLTGEQHVQLLRLHSLRQATLSPEVLAGLPPIRQPHHQTSAAAILGSRDGPGELSLALGGVFFLDELPEFRRDVLESLRQPLESGWVHVARAGQHRVWPCQSLLVAACNNCPCGWRDSGRRHCQCTQSQLLAYERRLSGPLLDRIDLHMTMPEGLLSTGDWLCRSKGGGDDRDMEAMRRAVHDARARSSERNRPFAAILNGTLPPRSLSAALGVGGRDLDEWTAPFLRAGVSNRAIVRSLRVARTVADLRGAAVVQRDDWRQALSWSLGGGMGALSARAVLAKQEPMALAER